MKLIEGAAALRCMPSRYHFALFRLIGYLRLRRIAHGLPPTTVLSIHPDQSVVEMYGVSLWIVLTVACYVAFWCSGPRLRILAAGVIAVPIAWCILQVVTVGTALLAPLIRRILRRPGEDNRRINSIVVMLLLTGVAAWEAFERSWVHFAAWQFLGILVLNGIAAILLLPLRSSITRLEDSFGGSSSASSSLLSH